MISEFFLIIFLAFFVEIIDSSLGMGYGTILSPLFIIILKYNASIVIPSILLSQALAGSIAGIFHKKYKNVNFKIENISWIENLKNGFTSELRFVILISMLAIFFTVLGVQFTYYINPIILKTYICILVLFIGIISLTKKKIVFSWKKTLIFGILATFNKGFTGGGFGPILTGGQIISGKQEKSSVGCTTLSQGPVCLTGFIAYLFFNNIQYSLASFLFPMILGASIAAPIGAIITKEIDKKSLHKIISILMILLGIWSFTKIWI
ncbi:TSUP family transporter [Candidatus Dependentiae bacterium]|nr:TSUP family transporter [Candidatus Dependentiae bacterium]